MKRKKLLIVLLVLSLLVIPASLTGCKPKTETETDTNTGTNSNSPFAALQARVESLQTRVTTLESKAGSTDLAPIKSDISNLKSDTQTLKDKLASIQSSISAIESKLNSLASTPTPTPTPAPVITPVPVIEPITISLRYPNVQMVTLPAGNSTTVTFPIKLKLENNLPRVVDDIVLSMSLNTRASLGLSIENTSIVSDLNWVQYTTNHYELWDELTLKASAKATYEMICSVTVSNILGTDITNGSVMLAILVQVESYDT